MNAGTGPLPLHELQFEQSVRGALAEDLGRAGDLTTLSVVPEEVAWQGTIVARQSGVIAGLEVAALAFRLVDPEICFKAGLSDGETVRPEQSLVSIEGSARGILTAERVALNFLGHLSGVASTTARLVQKIQGSGASVVGTRKTTPGLRALEKYAVRAGGGCNHRFGLDDAVLIKDNHLAVAGSPRAAISRVRERVGHLVKIEIEVDTLEQLSEALQCGVDAVLLDNMSPECLREAVRVVDGRAITEASGGITEATIGPIAETGVDLISVGWITHSAPSLDLGLDFDR